MVVRLVVPKILLLLQRSDVRACSGCAFRLSRRFRNLLATVREASAEQMRVSLFLTKAAEKARLQSVSFVSECLCRYGGDRLLEDRPSLAGRWIGKKSLDVGSSPACTMRAVAVSSSYIKQLHTDCRI